MYLPVNKILNLLAPAVLAAGTVMATETYLVRDGQPAAAIVTDAEAPRMVRLAAAELQTYLRRISGAELPILDAPHDDHPVTIHVGRSRFTDAQGIDDHGLDHGAFHMISGDDWLVLLGRDKDYVPREPYTMQRSSNNPDYARMLAEWDALTGDTYANPRGSLGRIYSRAMDLWSADQGGSLNAVYEFLRGLGVRWYMPGELGEVVPEKATIELPRVNRTVHPLFAWRQVAMATYFSSPREDILWYLRQGFTDSAPIGHFSHGLRDVTARPEMKAAHPERYALVRGIRHIKGNHACLSSEGLHDAAVNFARKLFDIYDLPMVSMMPQDGFNFCECALCEGQDTPDRGREGLHSDYVWGFVDRVAQEVYQSHPDKMINCLAYGTYLLPPAKIERLSPNVVVGIVHSRSRNFDDPETRERLLALRSDWRAKTDRPFWNWEHYPFTLRGTFTPFYFPRAIVDGIRSMRNDYFGEFIETAVGPFEERGHGMHAPGFNHLNLYVTGRFQWDPDPDMEALLAEYYRLFYGPAADAMQAFIEFSEINRRELQRDTALIDKALALFDAAVEAADPETAYGQRLALLSEYLQRLREWRAQLGRGRENVPVTTAPERAGAGFTLDGRLDDPVWRDLPQHPLVDVQTGEAARVPSWFKIFWDGGDRDGHLVVGIHCAEPDMANVRTLTADTGDWRVFDGDNVELLIETQSHSYYQLAVNAAGAMVDLDRNYGRLNEAWSSKAMAAAHQGGDYWSVEIRIPVTGEETPNDPLHELAGWRPTAAAPWHIQVGRQRLRGEDRQWTAWSPTGSNFHAIMRFGRLE